MVSRARLIDASEATLTEMHDISCRNMYICHVSNFLFECFSSAENKRKISNKRKAIKLNSKRKEFRWFRLFRTSWCYTSSSTFRVCYTFDCDIPEIFRILRRSPAVKRAREHTNKSVSTGTVFLVNLAGR